jgi:hypothetical protein
MYLSTYYLKENYLPKILSDEYGYWSAGAFFAGLDWSGVAFANGYYGWGYGLILSLILRLPLDAVASYRLAIILNGVFVFIIYVLAYKIAKELVLENNRYISALVALAAAMMPSVLYYTQYSMCEVILCLMYWVIIYIEWGIIKKPTRGKEILLIVCNAYILSIHLRAIGIVVVSFIVLLVVAYRNNSNMAKNVIRLCVIGGIVVAGVFVVKAIYQSKFFINDFKEIDNTNTLSGQIGKLSYLFSIEGFKSFVNNLFGRIYATFINSYLMVTVAVCSIINTLYKYFKNHIKIQEREWLCLVCILNTISSIAISSLYMIGATDSRFDILTYNRYHEFTLGPLILFGILYCFKMTKRGESICIVSMIILVCSQVITYIQKFDLTMSNMFINNPVGYWYVNNCGNLESCYYVMAFIGIELFIIFNELLKYRKKLGMVILPLLLIVFNIYQNGYTYQNGCLSWSVYVNDNYLKLLEYIELNDYEDNIYVIYDDTATVLDTLQYMLKNHKVNAISELQLATINENSIIVTNNGYDIMLEDNGFSIVLETQYNKIWKK